MATKDIYKLKGKTSEQVHLAYIAFMVIRMPLPNKSKMPRIATTLKSARDKLYQKSYRNYTPKIAFLICELQNLCRM